MLSITGTAGGKQVTLNSIATAAGQTVNITPLTDLIVSTASGQPGGANLAALCAPVANVVPEGCSSALAKAAREAMINAAKHARVERIDVYAETDGRTVEVFVREFEHILHYVVLKFILWYFNVYSREFSIFAH